MKISEYEFVYQSALQDFYSYLFLIAGLLIGSLPLVIFAFLPNYDIQLPNGFGIPVLVMCIIVIFIGGGVGFEMGSRIVSAGTLQLYSDYATLHYGSETLTLKKNEFTISEYVVFSKHAWQREDGAQKYWNINMDGHSIFFYEACLRSGGYDPSLEQAMMSLEASGLPTLPYMVVHARKKMEKRMKKASSHNGVRTLKIGKILISKGISTPAVFDNSPYYVDYSSCVAVKNVPLCTCFVREVSNPEHVVGDIGFADDKDNETPKPESILSKSVIVDGTALDERIGIE